MASCDKLTKQQGTEQAIELLRQVKKDAKKRPNASATNATNRLCVLTLQYQRILMPRRDLCARALALGHEPTCVRHEPTCVLELAYRFGMSRLSLLSTK